MPTYTISGAPVAREGNYLNFTVTRDGDVSGRALIGFDILTSGPASNGADTSVANFVVFAAGSTTGILQVWAAPDDRFEGDETITITLLGTSSGGTIGAQNTATGTIIDDGLAASVFSIAGAPSVVEGRDLVYTVSRTGDTSQAASVSYGVGGSADGADYLAPSSTVDFAAGAATAQITIRSVADRVMENAETVTVTLASVVRGQGTVSADPGSRVAEGIIQDNGQGTAPVPPTPTPPAGPAGAIEGTVWSDLLNGSSSAETIIAGFGNDTVNAGSGNDTVFGNQDNDELFGNEGQDHLFGGQGNDGLYGGKDADYVEGNFGDDRIYGNQGNDYLHGGRDQDYLHGGQDNDTLNGGAGDDILFGGLGSDTFVFAPGQGNDTIGDFSRAQGDILDLQGQTVASVSANASGDAILALSGGGVITLIGLTPSAFELGA